MKLKNKKCLVTGGAGFIGSNLCEELLRKGATVIAYDNLHSSSKDNIKHLEKNDKFRFQFGNMAEREFFRTIFHYEKFDYVFHLAATNVGYSVENPIYDLETNGVGTLNLLNAVKENPEVKMVHISSGSVLGSVEKGMTAMVENSVLKPTTPYAISKMAGEKYVEFYAKEYGLNISIIRYFHVFGPRQDMEGTCGVINIFLKRILSGLPPIVWGDGSQVKCFTYVMDSVKATIMLAEREKSDVEIYNCASDTIISIKDLAELLIEKYAEDKTMKPIFIEPKVGENMRAVPNVSKIKKIGFNADYTFEQGLELAKQWVANQL